MSPKSEVPASITSSMGMTKITLGPYPHWSSRVFCRLNVPSYCGLLYSTWLDVTVIQSIQPFSKQLKKLQSIFATYILHSWDIDSGQWEWNCLHKLCQMKWPLAHELSTLPPSLKWFSWERHADLQAGVKKNISADDIETRFSTFLLRLHVHFTEKEERILSHMHTTCSPTVQFTEKEEAMGQEQLRVMHDSSLESYGKFIRAPQFDK